VSVTGERVADEHHVGTSLVERAVRLVRHLDVVQPLTARERRGTGQHQGLRSRRGDASALDRSRHVGLHLLQCLLEVGEDVVDPLDADGQPHEFVADPRLLKLVL
jgi:hypothetical protein